MKALRKTSLICLLSAIFAITGCTPEDAVIVDSILNNKLDTDLSGTSWVCRTSKMQNGVRTEYFSTIYFESKTKGYLEGTTILNGDTISGGNEITYTYDDRKGKITLEIDNQGSFNMDFSVVMYGLKLKSADGQTEYNYDLMFGVTSLNERLIGNEWERTATYDDVTTTQIINFIDKQNAVIISSEINVDPQENEYDYKQLTYTTNGNKGVFRVNDEEFNFTIKGSNLEITDANGTTFTYRLRSATAPKTLENTSWAITIHEQYYYEDRGTYFESLSSWTYNFTTQSKGDARYEYSVPELSYLELDETETGQFTYTYHKPKGELIMNAEHTFNMVVFSDLLLIISIENQDEFILLKKQQ